MGLANSFSKGMRGGLEEWDSPHKEAFLMFIVRFPVFSEGIYRIPLFSVRPLRCLDFTSYSDNYMGLVWFAFTHTVVTLVTLLWPGNTFSRWKPPKKNLSNSNVDKWYRRDCHLHAPTPEGNARKEMSQYRPPGFDWQRISGMCGAAAATIM